MRNRLKGLGIFALIFFLSLLILGTSEVRNTSQATLFSQADINQEEVQSEVGGIKFRDGLLQERTDAREMSELVRKFPVNPGLLFLLFNQHSEESTDPVYSCFLSFSSFKDLSLTYHNLRV